ncbi:hypothetical protein CGRA01v4_13637 [Colletotrichum graminicola]|nr:hypothetical protein CGRA01v4_13637 [Colletotrichum graminicola]
MCVILGGYLGMPSLVLVLTAVSTPPAGQGVHLKGCGPNFDQLLYRSASNRDSHIESSSMVVVKGHFGCLVLICKFLDISEMHEKSFRVDQIQTALEEQPDRHVA